MALDNRVPSVADSHFLCGSTNLPELFVNSESPCWLCLLTFATKLLWRNGDTYCIRLSCCFITVQVRSRGLGSQKNSKTDCVCVWRAVAGDALRVRNLWFPHIKIYYQLNVVHFPCNFITNLIFNNKLLHNVIINYCSDTIRPQFLAFFRELVCYLIRAAYVYVNLFSRSCTNVRLKLQLK